MSLPVDEFHKLYYNSSAQTWGRTYWLGVAAQKCPLDLWIYQEIIFQLRPDLIVETGTADGGSALFLASVCDLIDRGKVITIDIEEKMGRPAHKRIEYWLGSSTEEEIVGRAKKMAAGEETVMVILDSDHHHEHVLRELQIYGPLVSPGSYLIVEDTNVNGHPVLPEFGPGPWEAVDDFLRGRDDFIMDERREKFFMTFNPKGFLLRVK